MLARVHFITHYTGLHYISVMYVHTHIYIYIPVTSKGCDSMILKKKTGSLCERSPFYKRGVFSKRGVLWWYFHDVWRLNKRNPSIWFYDVPSGWYEPTCFLLKYPYPTPPPPFSAHKRFLPRPSMTMWPLCRAPQCPSQVIQASRMSMAPRFFDTNGHFQNLCWFTKG